MTTFTSEQKAFFEKNGYVTLRGLVKENLEQLRERIQDIVSGRTDHHFFTRFGPGRRIVFYRIPQLAGYDNLFAELTRHPMIVDVVQRLIGPAYMYRDLLVGKPPHEGTPVVFHQDTAYLDLQDPHRIVSAWIALDDTPKEAGCLQLVAGSHHAPIHHDIYFRGHRIPTSLKLLLRRALSLTGTGDNPKTLRQRFFWMIKDFVLGTATWLVPSINDLNWLTVDRALTRTHVEVPIQAGDVIFFHGLLFHASGPNTSSNPRRAYIVTYLGEGAGPKEDPKLD